MRFEYWMEKMWQNPPTVVFTEGKDVRILKTARRLAETGLARPLILGNQFEIRAFAEENKIRLRGVALRKPLNHPRFDWYCRDFKKQFAPQEKIPTIRKILEIPELFAAQMLLHGDAQLCFLTQKTFNHTLVRVSQWLAEGKQMLSSFALLWNESQGQMLAFADVLFYPRPTAEQLADIALTTAQSFEKLSGQPAKVALLSFSTKGSADHPMVEKVRQAVQLLNQRAPQLKVEGEMQFDAAFVPEIGRKKAPNNKLNGAANVYVFPSLNAADIGFKIARNLTPLQTLGPFVQGLKHSLQIIEDERCEESLFKQIIVASNMINT